MTLYHFLYRGKIGSDNKTVFLHFSPERCRIWVNFDTIDNNPVVWESPPKLKNCFAPPTYATAIGSYFKASKG